MSMKTVVVMILALVCGSSAVVGVIRLRQPTEVVKVETAPVVIAAVDIARGKSLKRKRPGDPRLA